MTRRQLSPPSALSHRPLPIVPAQIVYFPDMAFPPSFLRQFRPVRSASALRPHPPPPPRGRGGGRQCRPQPVPLPPPRPPTSIFPPSPPAGGSGGGPTAACP